MGLVDVIFHATCRTWNPQRLLAWHSRGGESTFGLQSQFGGPKFEQKNLGEIQCWKFGRDIYRLYNYVINQ